MGGDIRIHDRLAIPQSEVDLQASRSGGPGGQHVNRTETKVELRWNVRASAVLTEQERERILRRLAGRINKDGELIVTAQEHRSQHRNREEAASRLAALVAGALARRKRRRATGPTAASRERRLQQKRRRSTLKKTRRERPEE